MVSLTERFKAKLGRRRRPSISAEKAGTDSLLSVTPHSETRKEPVFNTSKKTESIPERLWNRAYSQAKEYDAAIVDAYERILSLKLYQGDDSHSGSPQSALLESQINEIDKSPEKRRAQMRQLIQQGLQRTEKDANAKKDVEETMTSVMIVKNSMDKALYASPEVSIPWVGVCIALELLMNPLTEASSNRQGIAYVVSRMDWYWNMSSLLLSDNLVDPESEGLRAELEKVVANLYTTLLLFQMKSICYYYRRRFSVWVRDIIKLENWSGELSDIQAAEKAVHDDSAQYNTTTIRTRLSELAETAKAQNLTLVSIKSAVQEQTLKQENRHVEAANNECLVDLYATNPRDDKGRIEDRKGGLLRNAFLWILENYCFRAWRDDPQKRLLRIKADPGMGKTMLLCGIIDELEKSLGPTEALCYFFCQETDSRINSATAVLRGLVYMLVSQHQSLIKHVRKRYDQAGKNLFDGPNAFIVLCEIFKDLISDPNISTCYVLIDALDECVTDLRELLRRLVENVESAPRVKWIVTSRNLSHIEDWLEMPSDHLNLSLELSPEHVATGVRFFIEQRVEELAKLKKYNEKTRITVLKHLETNADGTFLWVALVCQDLQGVDRWDASFKVQSFPSGLKSLYKRMLEQLRTLDVSGRCKQILAVAAEVYRPITIHELVGLIESLEDFADDMESVKGMISLCGSFLTTRDETLYFVHQSAKEFLVDEAKADVFPEGRQVVHRTIFSRSLKILTRDLHRDMYNLVAPGYLAIDVRKPCPDPLRASRYSSIYWVYHLAASGTENSSNESPDLQDGGALDLFLKQKYLNWLEALSLNSSMSHGVVSMDILRRLIDGQANATELRDFVEDTRRHLMSTRFGIASSPLQTYESALLFSPKSSLTRRIFAEEEPDWVTINPGMDDEWGPCLYTIEGHSRSVIRSVVFSHDSKQMATASIDHTVKIWDVRSGVCLQTLEGHNGAVHDTVFSHDSTLLASASLDKTVKIWKATGECLHTLTDHQDLVEGVAFSADSVQLASNARGGSLKIWDVASGACIRTIKVGHECNTKPLLTFSNVFNKVACLECVETGDVVKIWNTNSGLCEQTLTNRQRWTSVSFTRDLSQAALARPWVPEIDIWDISKGVCLQTLRGHDQMIDVTAFSPDSGHLASRSRDGLIKVWDLVTGQCLRSIKGLCKADPCLAWSHDSTRLVTGGNDGTIRLWDISNTPSSQDHPEPFLEIKALEFSHDLGLLATGSVTGDIQIRDTSSATCLNSLTGHIDGVRSLMFSLDADLLVSGSDDETLKVWDLATGTCLRTLEGHHNSVLTVTFSHDSSLIASASGNWERSIFKVWDTNTGKCRQTILGPGNTVFYPVAFSPDSTQLVTVWSNFDIQILDIESGSCIRRLDVHYQSLRSLNAVVFSLDGLYLASTGGGPSAMEDELKIWDARTGACLATYSGFPHTKRLRLECTDKFVHTVYTDAGVFSLPEPQDLPTAEVATSLGSNARQKGPGFTLKHDWITYDGIRVIWLPAEHRTELDERLASGSKLVARSGKGKLRFYHFDPRRLYHALS